MSQSTSRYVDRSLTVLIACTLFISVAAQAANWGSGAVVPVGHFDWEMTPVVNFADDDLAMRLAPEVTPPSLPLRATPVLIERPNLQLKGDWMQGKGIEFHWMTPRFAGVPRGLIYGAEIALLFVLSLILIYTARHFFFTLNRLFSEQRHPYLDIDTAAWPSVTVFIAAHNEEAVISNSIEALLDVDYPADRLILMPVNDRSTDRTREIIDAHVERFPGRITPFHRVDGRPGKAAALKDATERVTSDIILVFDADYIPGRGLIKQLCAPFLDPETGAVMGRVVPLNTGSNLLTRLLDMERSGGYQVDQQARMNLGAVPQYGGTVGGVRRRALEDVGGWRDDALAEDTDLTYRLLLAGWKTVYQNRSECYEEVPEGWPVRVRQIMRWAKGHNQAAFRYAPKLLTSSAVGWSERLDGLLLLGVYAMSPLLFFGWTITIFLFYFSSGDWLRGSLALFGLMSYAAMGNFAAFFEIAAAIYLDGSGNRVRLLPFNLLGFLISMISISRATWNQIVLDGLMKRSLVWDKTVRYRAASPTGTASVAPKVLEAAASPEFAASQRIEPMAEPHGSPVQ